MLTYLLFYALRDTVGLRLQVYSRNPIQIYTAHKMAYANFLILVQNIRTTNAESSNRWTNHNAVCFHRPRPPHRQPDQKSVQNDAVQVWCKRSKRRIIESMMNNRQRTKLKLRTSTMSLTRVHAASCGTLDDTTGCSSERHVYTVAGRQCSVHR